MEFCVVSLVSRIVSRPSEDPIYPLQRLDSLMAPLDGGAET